MRVLDPGHFYDLAVYDGEGLQHLVFMKREGPGYPFNAGHHPGTNCQEVIRALIDRTRYLQSQIACPENNIILAGLRTALTAFELRAARRHKRQLSFSEPHIELANTCATCGHVECNQVHVEALSL